LILTESRLAVAGPAPPLDKSINRPKPELFISVGVRLWFQRSFDEPYVRLVGVVVQVATAALLVICGTLFLIISIADSPIVLLAVADVAAMVIEIPVIVAAAGTLNPKLVDTKSFESAPIDIVEVAI
jgi:hypothetical protein